MHTTTTTTPQQAEFIKIPEAATRLGTSNEQVYKLVKKGQIKCFSFGRKCLRIRISDLQEYIEKSIIGA